MIAVNARAQEILGRDVERVCQYFAAQGVACDADAIAADLWARYGIEVEEV